MDSKELKKGMKVRAKAPTYTGWIAAEYIGRWTDFFIFRVANSDVCILKTSREVAEEVRAV